MEPRWLALVVLTAARTSMGFRCQSRPWAWADPIGARRRTHADVGSLIGPYSIPGIVMGMPAGLLGRRVGDRGVVIVGLALLALGGIVPSLAQGCAGLAVGR